MKIIHKKVITSHVMCENKNKNSTKCHQIFSPHERHDYPMTLEDKKYNFMPFT
jgi:hypothetical protein